MGFHNGGKIVTDDLLFAFDSQNTRSYPGSGTTWTDLSGNGHTFSIGSATYVSESLHWAGDLTNGSKTVSASTGFFTGSYSIEVIFKSTTLGNVNSNCGSKPSTLWAKPGSGGNSSTQWLPEGHWVSIAPAGSDPEAETATVSYRANGKCDSADRTAQLVNISAGTISRNEVVHLVCVHSQTAGTFYAYTYKNGVLVASGGPKTQFEAPAGTFYIGGLNPGNCSNSSFIGHIYSFRMYGRALSAKEIAHSYKIQRGRMAKL